MSVRTEGLLVDPFAPLPVATRSYYGNYSPLFPHPCRPDRDDIPVSRWWDPAGELRGINLRSWLAVTLHDSDRVLSVTELTRRLEATGFVSAGRASKTISDALRWEVARGRIRRVARGAYRVGDIAKATLHRMRRRIASCQRYRTANCNKQQPVIDWAGITEPESPLSALVVATTRNPMSTPTANLCFQTRDGPNCRPPP